MVCYFLVKTKCESTDWKYEGKFPPSFPVLEGACALLYAGISLTRAQGVAPCLQQQGNGLGPSKGESLEKQLQLGNYSSGSSIFLKCISIFFLHPAMVFCWLVEVILSFLVEIFCVSPQSPDNRVLQTTFPVHNNLTF